MEITKEEYRRVMKSFKDGKAVVTLLDAADYRTSTSAVKFQNVEKSYTDFDLYAYLDLVDEADANVEACNTVVRYEKLFNQDAKLIKSRLGFTKFNDLQDFLKLYDLSKKDLQRCYIAVGTPCECGRSFKLSNVPSAENVTVFSSIQVKEIYPLNQFVSMRNARSGLGYNRDLMLRVVRI